MDDQYVDSFVNEGLIFMNNIEFFRKYEDSDIALRGDVYEGLASSLKAEKINIYIGDHKVDGAVGKVDIRKNHEDLTNIYSMTKISDGNIIEAGENGLFLSDKFKKLGNSAVVIGGKNIHEFQNRVKRAITASKEIYTLKQSGVVAKKVRYLSRDDHHGQMDVFDKFDEYAWQYEWRIAFKQNADNGPYALRIGNLSGISCVCKTNEMLNHPIKLAPREL
jgi:hypothetical protein